MIRVFNIDWLSIYCGAPMIIREDRYILERKDMGTAVFKDMYDVVDTVKNESVATITKTPYSKLIPKDAAIITFKNRMFYRPYWNEEVQTIMWELQLVPRSISRLDVCCDFHKFENNLHPENFIRKFLEGKYLKMRKCVFSLDGHQDMNTRFDYIRFGKRDHEISAYIYNKTKELREVKDKPYIRQSWKEGGLEETPDVWRMEFSLSNKQMKYVQRSTGETFRIGLEWIQTNGQIHALFDAILCHYMDFRINDGQFHKHRMKKLELFGQAKSLLHMYCPTNKAQSGRMDKIIINKLTHYAANLRLDPGEIADLLDRAAEAYADQKDMHLYYEQSKFRAQGDVKGA